MDRRGHARGQAKCQPLSALGARQKAASMGGISMNNSRIREMNMVALFAALSIVGGMFIVIPTPFARCAPVQHIVNVMCAVMLGPRCGVTAAFIASVIRNLLGIGTLVAFPGSMCGAWLSGMMYRRFHKVHAAVAGEIIGTGIIGALLAYPVSSYILGNSAAAIYTFIVPFTVSTAAGSAISAVIICALEKMRLMSVLEESGKQ